MVGRHDRGGSLTTREVIRDSIGGFTADLLSAYAGEVSAGDLIGMFALAVYEGLGEDIDGATEPGPDGAGGSDEGHAEVCH